MLNTHHSPHQKYLLKSLPSSEEPDKEINVNEFFINFAFNNRETAENAFAKAIEKLMDYDQVQADLKEYIKEVYIDNNFKEVCMSFLSRSCS